MHIVRSLLALAAILSMGLLPALPALAQSGDFSSEFDRSRCHFTTTGDNPYFPLQPGYSTLLEGLEEDDEGELVEISVRITVLSETERVDGVTTRVVEEFEQEDGELVEVSRNFMAVCRETGDIWYFGEDVDDYEDGEIVGHGGEWRAGIGGARPGVVIPGSPLVGARHYQEVAPGVALDHAEIVSLDAPITVPFGSFDETMMVVEGTDLDPDEESLKWYAPGIGLVKDDEAELVEVTLPPCLADATTHCLNDGRFQVRAHWGDAEGDEGEGQAILASADSGEFYFFNADNTELIVKVIDACQLEGYEDYWVFLAGLTNVEVEVTVVDTLTQTERVYANDLGSPFEPQLDTNAFFTCP